MLRKTLIVSAVSGLALATAFAQTSPSTTLPSTTKAVFIAKQGPDQLLMSRFKGTRVMGVNDEKIGSVDDILFDKTGSILAYVVGVGGFLGIGAKEVALAPASFQIITATDGADPKLRLAMTKDELKNAATFEPYIDRSPMNRPTGPATPAPRTN